MFMATWWPHSSYVAHRVASFVTSLFWKYVEEKVIGSGEAQPIKNKEPHSFSSHTNCDVSHFKIEILAHAAMT